MALSQSVLSELLDAFRAGEGVDLVRDAVRLVMQELIEIEATERIGADRYERNETRVTERNGSRQRLLATQAGDVELKIPKLRKGSFFPSILEPRRRIDQALYAVVMEAYVNGVSTRSVDDLVAALGVDSGISKSEVSRVCAGLDEIVGAFRTRRLDHVEFPYVYLDATYLHVRNSASQVCSMAVVVATGITPTAPVKSSASTSATARMKCSGGASCGRSRPAGSPGCASSSPINTPASSPP
jgi:transposase-like protein